MMIMPNKTKAKKTKTIKKTLAKRSKKASLKSLRFDQIEIIELPFTLGDNPCVNGGAPLSCSWDPQLRVKVSLETFEKLRPKRRALHELILGKELREMVLTKHGFSEGDISQAEIDAKKVQLERMLSKQFPLI